MTAPVDASTGPFAKLIGQPKVREHLSTAVANGAVAQAYLFVGPPVSGKTDAAWMLAKALLCEKGGCGTCDSCIRVARRTHPDVHVHEPDGASGYMVDQIRELVRDTSLAPVRAARKVYILDRADLLGTSAANAFLKTLEEPPADVTFILLGRSREQVLTTIVSRCQVVPFRTIPATEAARVLCSATGCSDEQALRALAACGGSLAKARTFLLSPSRREVRHRVLEVLDRMAGADDLDILDNARDLLIAVKAPLDDVRASHAAQLEESRDYLGKGAITQLEKRQKRELTAREREGLVELLNIVRSWLRDLLLLSSNVTAEPIVNGDHDAALNRVSSQVEPGALTAALAAVDEAQARISYNVSSQLVIETMLFSIREVLSCQR